MSTDNEENCDDSMPQQAVPSAPEPGGPMRKPNGQYNKTFTGNSKGRPKKPERAWSHHQFTMDVLSEANKEVQVTADGKSENVSMHNLLIRALIHKGVKGDTKAAKMALEAIHRAQSGRELKEWQFFKDLEKVERIANQPPISVLEDKTPVMLPTWRKWSRKV
jgi:hypothetical protein